MARKVHTCGECREDIQPGEDYCRTTTNMDGKFYHFITCERCQDLCESMWELGFCFDQGELWNAHEEYVREYQPPTLGERK
jgi:hypothetical protein